MSLISRLRAVVAGDDYLDGDLDDLVYEDEQQEQDQRATHADGGALATIADPPTTFSIRSYTWRRP